MIDIYPVKEEYIHDFEYMDENEMPSIAPISLGDSQQVIDRCINLAGYAKNLEAEAAALKTAADAIYERLTKIQKKAERCKEIVHATMEFSGLERITQSPHFAIKIKKNPPRLVIENPLDIPPEYKSIEQREVINNEQIKEDLKIGLWVPGAVLEQKTRLEIK